MKDYLYHFEFCDTHTYTPLFSKLSKISKTFPFDVSPNFLKDTTGGIVSKGFDAAGRLNSLSLLPRFARGLHIFDGC